MPHHKPGKLAYLLTGSVTVVVLLVGFLIWMSRPAAFRAMGYYPLNVHGIGNTQFSTAGFSIVDSLGWWDENHIYAFDWNGLARWQVHPPGFHPRFKQNVQWWQFQLSDNVSSKQSQAIRRYSATSPDGHWYIEGEVEWTEKQISASIQSWNNGQACDKVRVHWEGPKFSAYKIHLFQVTDSGRIWFYETNAQARRIWNGHIWYYAANVQPCRFWAIDGTHIASGLRVSLTSSDPSIGGDSYNVLSENGTTLVSRYTNKQTVEFSTVQVCGEKVVITRQAVLTNQPFRTAEQAEAADLHLANNKYARQFDGLLAATSGRKAHWVPSCDWWFYCAENKADIICKKTGNHFRIFCPLQRSRWDISSKATVRWLSATPDGRYVLVVAEQRSGAANPLTGLVGTGNSQGTPYLYLYERPGRLRAQFHLYPLITPLRGRKPNLQQVNSNPQYQVKMHGNLYTMSNWSLSPDGQRLVLLVTDAKGQPFCFVYRW